MVSHNSIITLLGLSVAVYAYFKCHVEELQFLCFAATSTAIIPVCAKAANLSQQHVVEVLLRAVFLAHHQA